MGWARALNGSLIVLYLGKYRTTLQVEIYLTGILGAITIALGGMKEVVMTSQRKWPIASSTIDVPPRPKEDNPSFAPSKMRGGVHQGTTKIGGS